MHIIITGSRDAVGKDVVDFVYGVLDNGLSGAAKASNFVFEGLSHGDAKGIDRIAGRWAKDRNIPVHTFKANWNRSASGAYDKAAGIKRNVQMLKESVDLYGSDGVMVLAFSTKPLADSNGTNHCVRTALSMGLNTHLFRTDLKATADAELPLFAINATTEVETEPASEEAAAQ